MPLRNDRGPVDALSAPAVRRHPSIDVQLTGHKGRQTLLTADKPGMAIWREKLFAWMMRNAATPMEFFRLPTNRVVELGSQVEI